MRAVIIGAGKIGYNIAETLSQEGHDVFVIEKDEERQQVVEENLDVQALLGNGADSRLLESIEIEKADLLIAVTENDELNMLSCMLAGQYGVKKTVARVRKPEYNRNNKLSSNPALNVDLLINPERVARCGNCQNYFGAGSGRCKLLCQGQDYLAGTAYRERKSCWSTVR